MTWWQRLRRTEQLENQLDAELRFHFERLVAENVRGGMDAGQALRAARLQFGGLEQVREGCRDARGTRWVESTVQDIRFALRQLRLNPAFTVVAVLALALGIGANTAVFTVVHGVLLRPLAFPEPERLFLVSHLREHGVFHFQPGLADGDYLEFRRQDQVFERVATFGGSHVTLTGAGEPVSVAAASVTLDFIPLLRVNPAMGRTFLPEEGTPGRDHVVLLSEQLWRSRFNGDPHAIGKTITLDGIGHTVIGIMPRGFAFPYEAALWTPLIVTTNPHNSMLRPVVGRLKPGVSPRQALAELESIASRFPLHGDETRTGRVTQILPLKELLVGEIRPSLWIFAGAVALVLLIACANVANLLLLRAASRQQEIAMRAALGAGRGRLVRQLLTESTLVSLAGGAAGMLLAVWGVPALLALAPAGRIPRVEDIRIDRWVLAFTFGVSVITGITFGLAPAFQATRRVLRDSLSQGARTLTGRRERLRSTLVISEIALALVLLTGSGLMVKSFLRMRAVNPGFRPENVLTMTVDLPESIYHNASEMRAFDHRILAKLSGIPEVLAAGAVNWLPLGGALTRGDFHIESGAPLPPDYMVDKPAVSPNYFRAMGIRLLSGRDFTERDHAGAPGVAIVTESVARKLWPGESAMGKRITMEDRPKPSDWLTIVGVVDDVRQRGLTKEPDPAIYQPYLQMNRTFFLSHMTFTVRAAAQSQSVASAMRIVLHEVDKDQPVQTITTMQDVLANTTAEPQFQTRLLGLFSLLALTLAAIGIYGVLAYSVTERTHEIGIRMALGAQRSAIVRMVLHRTLILTAAGVALGTAGALAATRVLAKFLFDVKPTDPATFMTMAVLLGVTALFAGLLPARRATRVDPMVALRQE